MKNQNNIRINTMLFIVHHMRKDSNFIIKILNLIIKIKQTKIDQQDEEKIVNDFFKNFNKKLLNFSKFTYGTTLAIYNKDYIEYDILKSNISLHNLLYKLFNSLEKNAKTIQKDKINTKYIEKYLESFDKILDTSYNVFKENIKKIKSFCTNNPYVEDLEQILEIIKLIQDKFLD